MTVVKYDTRDVDRSQNKRPSDIPSIGLHRCKVVECDFQQQKGKEPQLVVVYAIDEPGRKSDGYRMWSYITWNLDSVQWKKDQFLEAMGIKKQVGSFDTAKMVGKPVTVRVQHNEWNGSVRAKPNGVWLVDEDDEDVEEYEDEPEEDDEDVEYEDEDEELDEDEDEELDEEEYEEEDEMEEEEPPPPPRKAAAKKAPAKKAAPARTAAQKRAAAVVEEADPYDDEETWTIAKLKKECRDRDLSDKGARSALVARLRTNDADPFE